MNNAIAMPSVDKLLSDARATARRYYENADKWESLGQRMAADVHRADATLLADMAAQLTTLRTETIEMCAKVAENAPMRIEPENMQADIARDIRALR